jgi:hypothetical protein
MFCMSCITRVLYKSAYSCIAEVLTCIPVTDTSFALSVRVIVFCSLKQGALVVTDQFSDAR